MPKVFPNTSRSMGNNVDSWAPVYSDVPLGNSAFHLFVTLKGDRKELLC